MAINKKTHVLPLSRGGVHDHRDTVKLPIVGVVTKKSGEGGGLGSAGSDGYDGVAM